MDTLTKWLLVIVASIEVMAAYAEKQNVICHTQILVTTPQTVGFYLGATTKNNFVGYAKVGQWLRTYAVCVKNKKINAEVWDQNGKKHVYKTKNDYNNINTLITLIYPEDFKGAPQMQDNVFCNIHVMNDSHRVAAFYVKHSMASYKLTVLEPSQSKLISSPCFSQENVIVRVLYKDKGLHCAVNDTSDECIKDKYDAQHPNRWKEGQRYKSLRTYTSINTIPYITFPSDFRKAVTLSL